MAPTRGVAVLKRAGVPFEVILYDHLVKGAEFAAESTGIPLSAMIKTLVVKLDDGRFCIALMPGDRNLSLKSVARAMGVKSAAMAEVAEAERHSGYQVGGISPFGFRKALPALLETSLAALPEVTINAGGRGVLVKLHTESLISVLHPRIEDIAADE